MTVKQVIVIRRDLHMRQEKAIAQGAHAAMMFLLEAYASVPRKLEPAEGEWLEFGMGKIVVRVESEQELRSIILKCADTGVKCFPITDAGRTEFHGIPTLTCCAIGPDYTDKIDAITGGLKLL